MGDLHRAQTEIFPSTLTPCPAHTGRGWCDVYHVRFKVWGVSCCKVLDGWSARCEVTLLRLFSIIYISISECHSSRTTQLRGTWWSSTRQTTTWTLLQVPSRANTSPTPPSPPSPSCRPRSPSTWPASWGSPVLAVPRRRRSLPSPHQQVSQPAHNVCSRYNSNLLIVCMVHLYSGLWLISSVKFIVCRPQFRPSQTAGIEPKLFLSSNSLAKILIRCFWILLDVLQYTYN